MDIDQSARTSGEEPNLGNLGAPTTPTTPRPAATVILLRGGTTNLEVLLVRRNPSARFMGGVWVFPGGAVNADEGDGDPAHRAAAIRELREEASVTLDDPDALVQFSRWITPAQVKTRYDTHFFLAPMPEDQEPQVDGEECVDLGWFTPAAALDAHRTGKIALVFPTIKHLEQLSVHGSASELIAYAREQTVEPVLPRVVVDGDSARVLLPGEPGYAG
jgi:8-oxo-dGTP pyrophosphatase MutT (NUDIX family)